MIRLADNLWIGLADEQYLNLGAAKIGAVLNVAQDLQSMVGWESGIEHMQVGLIDGPGNPISAYYAVVLALATLLKRHNTLVFCHGGSRSMAVCLIYLNLTMTRDWKDIFSILHERVEVELPIPHKAHIDAFSHINWRLLANILNTGDR